MSTLPGAAATTGAGPAAASRGSPRTTRAGVFGSGGQVRRFGRKTPWVREAYEKNGGNDFAGKWSRIQERTVGLVEGYIARGNSPQKAVEHCSKAYVQTWRPAAPAQADPDRAAAPDIGSAEWRRPSSAAADAAQPPTPRDGTQWELVTYEVDGITPRRHLVYLLGVWDEHYQLSAQFHRGKGPGVVRRHTSWLPDPNSVDGLAHVTLSKTQLGGEEEARRYINKDDEMVLMRSFRASPNDPTFQSTEIFRRVSHSTEVGPTPEETAPELQTAAALASALVGAAGVAPIAAAPENVGF